MEIEKLLSTPERTKMLSYLLYHPREKVGFNSLARKLSLSPGQIHKYAAILVKEGLLEGGVLEESAKAQALRLVFNLARIEEAAAVQILRKRFPKLKGVGLFGSWAAGTNDNESDVDFWLKLDDEPPDLELARARAEIGKKLSAEADLTIATGERLEQFKKKSEAFYYSLYSGKTLWGEAL